MTAVTAGDSTGSVAAGAFVGHAPPAALRPYVAFAHGYRVPAMPGGLHRGLPTRHLTLVIELLAPLRARAAGRWDLRAHSQVAGLHTQPALIDATGPQEGLQYALTPLGARALLGVSAADLCEQAVTLGEIIGVPLGLELVERLCASAGWPQRFALLDAVLLGRLDDREPRPPAEVAEAWRMIFANNGRVRIAEVATEVGRSRRHLSEQFRRCTGVTPKQAARIARFELARRLLLAPTRPPLAALAAHCGYADQSHFAREWRTLAGCDVSTWLAEEFPFVQDVTRAPTAESPA